VVAYIVRRMLYMIPVLIGVAVLVFMLFNTVGEDPVRVALGVHATPQSIAELRHKWGLDQPVYIQLLDFFRQILTFDYGISFNTGEQLSKMFAAGAAVSLWLTVPPFVAGLFVNIGLGMLVAYYRGSLLDRFATAILVMTMSISYLVYIIAFQYFFAFRLGIFPINGYERGLDGVQYVVLPWFIMLIVTMGEEVRMYRTMFLDETQSDYVRTARAKGLSEPAVLVRHVLQNALIPIVTYTMVAIPFLLMGAFLMERFFSLPGVGDLMITSINTGDFPVLKGLTMVLAIAYATMILLTDIIYAWVDPRVSLR